MKNKTILYNGAKSVDIWGDRLDGWTILSGEGRESTDSDYYKLIPTLYRAVQIISYYISTMPFSLMKGKTEYDTSIEWENKIGFMPNPFTILQLIVGSLELAGNCYLFRERNQAVTKELHYHLPNSVTPIISPETGKIISFDRPVNGVIKHFTEKDYIYFWLPDPYVEVGPAVNFPAKAAANACGVLLNMDLFASNFFEHGAVKVTLLTVTGMPDQAERLKLTEWWRRVISGVKNAFGSQVINADAVKPVVIGEGMKELENVTISEEKREDIAIAMGIPMSILFANAANYATSQQDVLNFLTQTIIPLCQFIESILNEQLFDDLGLHWEFLPETIDAMQEDEASRAVALKDLTGAGVPLLMAFDILGYELSDEDRATLEQAEADKKAKAEELAKQMAQKPAPIPPDQQPTDQTSQQSQSDTTGSTTFKSELDKWRRKAINAMKKGKPANVEFVSEIIPTKMYETIMTALGNAKDEDDVKEAFDMTTTPEPVFSDSIIILANELHVANELLKKEMEK